MFSKQNTHPWRKNAFDLIQKRFLSFGMQKLLQDDISVCRAARLENICVYSNASSATTFASQARSLIIIRKWLNARILLPDLSLVFVLWNFGIVCGWMRFMVPKILYEDWFVFHAAKSQRFRCVLAHILKTKLNYYFFIHVKWSVSSSVTYYLNKNETIFNHMIWLFSSYSLSAHDCVPVAETLPKKIVE